MTYLLKMKKNDANKNLLSSQPLSGNNKNATMSQVVAQKNVMLVGNAHHWFQDLQDAVGETCKVHWCPDFDNATHHIENSAPSPELILLAIRSTRSAGYAHLCRYRQKNPTMSIPVIILAEKASPASRMQALRDGAVDFFSSPISFTEIALKINSLLEIIKAARHSYSAFLKDRILQSVDSRGQERHRRVSFHRQCRKYGLTSREMETAHLLLNGLSYKEIAGRLFVSEKTISSHIGNIYRKTSAGNRIELIELLHE